MQADVASLLFPRYSSETALLSCGISDSETRYERLTNTFQRMRCGVRRRDRSGRIMTAVSTHTHTHASEGIHTAQILSNRHWHASVCFICCRNTRHAGKQAQPTGIKHPEMSILSLFTSFRTCKTSVHLQNTN